MTEIVEDFNHRGEGEQIVSLKTHTKSFSKAPPRTKPEQESIFVYTNNIRDQTHTHTHTNEKA